MKTHIYLSQPELQNQIIQALSDAKLIDKVEVIRRSTTKRAKLYYIRTKVARDIRRKMRNFMDYFASTADLIPKEEAPTEAPSEETKESSE